jgi:hypothetical protein
MELGELHSRRVDDAALVNDVVTKWEMIAFVLLLAKGLTDMGRSALPCICFLVMIGVNTPPPSASFFTKKARFLNLSSPSANKAQKTILDRETTHQALAQAVMKLQEGLVLVTWRH